MKGTNEMLEAENQMGGDPPLSPAEMLASERPEWAPPGGPEK